MGDSRFARLALVRPFSKQRGLLLCTNQTTSWRLKYLMHEEREYVRVHRAENQVSVSQTVHLIYFLASQGMTHGSQFCTLMTGLIAAKATAT